MRSIHRISAALIALMFCLLSATVSLPMRTGSALAEEQAPELEITASVSPGTFVTPGETEISFTLTNLSSGLLEGVCLTSPDGLLVEPVGDMAAGAVLTYTRVHNLTQAELDAGTVEYIITCVSGSDHFSFPVSAFVEKIFPDPEVEFLRQVSSRFCADGDSVTVIYRLRNVGNVPVTAISVTDPLGTFDGRLESLDVGKTKVFVQYASVAEPTDSIPTLSYSSESNSDIYTLSLDPLTIEPARSMLDATLTAGRSIFSSDTAEVVLQLVNGGNVDYLDVTICDDVYGGVIADSITLPAGGEPVEVARSFPLRGDSSYRWRVTGRTSAGERIDMITNTENVSLDSDGGEPLLTLSASTSMPQISRRGYVPVRLEISNIGGAMASNVHIREESGGDIRTLAVIPTGNPTVCEFQYEINENSLLTFSAVYSDSFGRERTATSDPLEITIGRGGQSPLSSKARSLFFSGMATQMPDSGLFMALLIGACLLLAALIVVLVITSRRARIRRRAKKMRLQEEMGKTNRFKPVRVRDKKKTTSKK